MSEARFVAVLQTDMDGGVFIEVPADVVGVLGERKRPPVRVTLNGYRYRTTIAAYGGRSYLPVRREIREAAGLTVGDAVSVTAELDELPRVVELPDDLRMALDSALGAREGFERLSYTRRKETVEWVNSARREETRHARIEKAVAAARNGSLTP